MLPRLPSCAQKLRKPHTQPQITHLLTSLQNLQYSNPKSRHSFCFLFVYNQERRANGFILFDVAVSGPRISKHVDNHLLYILYVVSISMCNQATTGYFVRTNALIIVQIPSGFTDHRIIPRRWLLRFSMQYQETLQGMHLRTSVKLWSVVVSLIAFPITTSFRSIALFGDALPP